MVGYPAFVEARSVAGNQQRDSEKTPDLPPDIRGACLWHCGYCQPLSAAAG
jgi:hypothetical protein